MKRIEYCKQQIQKCKENEKNIDKLYQELNNSLLTFKDKKALREYVNNIKKTNVIK